MSAFLAHIKKNRSNIQKDLQAVFKKYGISAKLGNARIGPQVGTMKINLAYNATAADSDPWMARLIADWPRYAIYAGLKVEWLGQFFHSYDGSYRIVGWDRSKRGRGINSAKSVIATRGGKYYKFPPEFVANAMEKVKVA